LGRLEETLLGHSASAWFIAAAVSGLVAVALLLIRTVLLRRLKDFAKRTPTRADDLAAALIEKTKLPFVIVISLYAGWLTLAPSPSAARAAGSVALVAFLLQLAVWANGLVLFWTTREADTDTDRARSADAMRSVLGFVVRLGVWIIVLLLVLENLGVNVTALAAGLGVGGIAVALAVQSVLADLLASVSIALDRPFSVGDFIVLDDLAGTVEHVGLKTTRLRSLSGEQLVIANGDLLRSRIHNYQRMVERRVVLSLGVPYETAYEKLEAIPRILGEAVRYRSDVRLERVHFKDFADSALLFEVVYCVLHPGYAEYMDARQAVNLAIVRRFEEERIQFAYPTQTVLLQRGAPAGACGTPCPCAEPGVGRPQLRPPAGREVSPPSRSSRIAPAQRRPASFRRSHRTTKVRMDGRRARRNKKGAEKEAPDAAA